MCALIHDVNIFVAKSCSFQGIATGVDLTVIKPDSGKSQENSFDESLFWPE